MSTKKLVLAASVAVLAVCAFAAKKNADPVLLTIDGKPVYKSEFLYLYNKNASQQVSPQSLDDYLKMFIDYKLKVAEAEAAGLDTTTNFKDEYNQFRTELADPYMRDSAAINRLVEDAYRHYLTEVKVSHIMLPLGQTSEEAKENEARLNTFRNEIIAGKVEWDSVAANHSIDRGSSQRGGSMGWLGVGRTPWEFEKTAYDTPVGEISPVINSGFGLHIVRPDEKRPARGEVLVQHILKLTMNRPPEEQAIARQKIDSIYTVLQNPGADFSAVAAAESEDGTRNDGGKLPWFGAGAMVAEFDSVAFALRDGEISKPFATSYGYHIVKRLDSRGVAPLDEMRQKLEGQVNGDDRGAEARRAYIATLVSDFNGQVMKDGLDKVEKFIRSNPGGYDSVAIAALRVSDIPVVLIGGVKYPVRDVMPGVAVTASTDPANARGIIASSAEALLSAKALDLERNRLLESNPEYRNLVNEYRDGILLFEISNRNVWEKAAKDAAGLEKFFQKNKSNYKWDAPKYKGFIVFASSDSLLNEARAFADSLGTNLNRETFAADMRARFGRDVKVERVLAAKGDNAISDYLVFDGPEPDDTNLRWKHFFAYGGHIADQPEEAIDVRGAVTTDYQNELEQQWLKSIRGRHKVVVDKKVFSAIKE